MKSVRAMVPLNFSLNEGGGIDVSAAFIGISCFCPEQRRSRLE
jgi:hypothetical protein